MRIVDRRAMAGKVLEHAGHTVLVMAFDKGPRVAHDLGRICGITTPNATNYRTLCVEVEIDHRSQVEIKPEAQQPCGRLRSGGARPLAVSVLT